MVRLDRSPRLLANVDEAVSKLDGATGLTTDAVASLVVIPARIPVVWRHSVIGSRHVMWFSIVWVGLSRSIRIAIVGGPRSPRSTSVIRASSPAAIKRCGRDCSSRAECCGARNPRTYNTSAVTVRSPPILPPRNACDTYWRQGAADPCLGTLNR